ncbi:MAG: glycosyltransferase family 4 protein [Caldilineaceae bacterium]|nr:glycosyltransferase family 4 protein [Caldilineaceae bacterium]
MDNRNRQRVLFIEKPPFVGGSVISLYELVSRLDHSRFEPVMLFFGPNPYRERFRQLGIQVETLSEQMPGSSQNTRDIAGTLGRYSRHAAGTYAFLKDLYRFAQRDYPIAKRTARYIEELRIDLVHHNNCLSTDRATVLGAALARVPQTVHVRTLGAFGMVERYLARSVDGFIYISQAVEGLYRGLGIPREKGHIIYNGFTLPQAHTDASHLRKEFGLCAQDRVISNVGRIEWWKGQDYFLETMAQIVKMQPNTKALLVGGVDSTQQNEAYHHKLQQMTQELGLANHVIFTGFRSDIPQIMAMSDLVVHSASEPEPFGRVVVEAMLAGRPVVATAAGGVLDIIEDKVTGLTVPPKDVAAMTGAIQYLLHRPAEAAVMGQRAQQEASKRFSVEQHVRCVQSLYQQILD